MLLPRLGRVSVRCFATKTHFSHILHEKLKKLDNLFLVGVTRFHEITGYSEIERIKAELARLEVDVELVRGKVRDARENYGANVAKRSDSQREMNELLMRKPTWLAVDLDRFTQLYKADHEIQLGVEKSKREYDEIESELEEMQIQVGKLIGARYREEQMFSDRIRQASTWGTWVLMGINIVLFVIVQLILEPWKRKRLVKSFENKVHQMFEDQNQRELEEIPIIAQLASDSITESKANTRSTSGNIADADPTWSNLWQRLQLPTLTVRPVEIAVLALIFTTTATIVPFLFLAVSSGK